MLEIGERPWGKYFVLQDELILKLKDRSFALIKDFLINTIIIVKNFGQS